MESTWFAGSLGFGLSLTILPVTHPSGVHTATCVLMGGVLGPRAPLPCAARIALFHALCVTPQVAVTWGHLRVALSCSVWGPCLRGVNKKTDSHQYRVRGCETSCRRPPRPLAPVSTSLRRWTRPPPPSASAPRSA
jgi:hypothetical protein